MRSGKVIGGLVVTLVSLGLNGCVHKAKGYTDAEEKIVVGTGWSDTDNQVVAEVISKKILSNGCIGNSPNGDKPAVGIARVRNLTSEEIDTDALVNFIKDTLQQTKRVKFIANQDSYRHDIEKEVAYQQSGAVKASSRAEVGKQVGVGYFLNGDLSSKTESDDDVKVVNYQVNFRLVNIETSEEVCSGQHRLRKTFER